MTQLILPLETRPALGREDFIVAPANREAVAFIDAFPAWPTPVAALYGPGGSGKSHLAAAWATRAGATILDGSLLDESVLLCDAPTLVIEDVDARTPDASRDVLLFALIERSNAILLTGREAPSHWQASIPDLASRYRAMMSFALWAPDDALLGAMAKKLFADRQISVSDGAIDFMIRSLERSPDTIRDFVAQTDAKALAEKRPVSAALIREILAEQQGVLF